jgi:hypothetical protein
MKSALLAWTFVIAMASLVAGAAALAPEALRGVDEFHVARVVVHGAANLEPADALAASGITATTSIFDDEAVWLDGRRARPLVRSARFERELPTTLHVHVQETSPLAFAQTPELRAVDERGNVLPVRAGELDLDLPIVGVRSQVGVLATPASIAARGRSFLRVTDEPTLRALALLATLEQLDAELAALVSEATPLARSDVLLTLRAPAGLQLMLTVPPSAAQLRAIRLTLAHLRAVDDAEPARVRIDVRFHDQVVVAPSAQPQGSNTGGAR